MSYDCDNLAESLEIDKIQRELMNEEIEILRFSSQGQAKFPGGMSALSGHNEAYHWQATPSCGAFDSDESFVVCNQSFVDQNQSFAGCNQSFVDPNRSFVNQSFVDSNQPFVDSFQNPDAMSSDMFNSQNVILEPVFQDSSQNLAFGSTLSDAFFQDFQQPRNFSENFSGPHPSNVPRPYNIYNEPAFRQRPMIAHDNDSIVHPSSHSASSSALELNHFGNQCYQNNPQQQQQQHRMVCQGYNTFPQPAPLVDNSGFAGDDSFCEKLEAARRRASTGSVVGLRSKKHVSFAVPNMVMAIGFIIGDWLS